MYRFWACCKHFATRPFWIFGSDDILTVEDQYHAGRHAQQHNENQQQRKNAISLIFQINYLLFFVQLSAEKYSISERKCQYCAALLQNCARDFGLFPAGAFAVSGRGLPGGCPKSGGKFALGLIAHLGSNGSNAVIGGREQFHGFVDPQFLKISSNGQTRNQTQETSSS